MERIEICRWKLLYILERASNKMYEKVNRKLIEDNERLEAELSQYVMRIYNHYKEPKN